MFIDEKYINQVLQEAKDISREEISKILDRAEKREGLSHKEVASLLVNDCPEIEERIYSIAGKIKEDIYGNRAVVFAPPIY